MKPGLFFILMMFVISGFAQRKILDNDFKNKEGSVEMAVMVINRQEKTLNQPLTQNVSEVLKNSKGYNTNPSFFNTGFIKKGDFEKIFNADPNKINKLHLKDNLDFICLGKYQINGITKNEYNMFTADVTLQLNIIDVKSGAVADSRTYKDRGIGVTKEDAELNVRNKLTEQLK